MAHLRTHASNPNLHPLASASIGNELPAQHLSPSHSLAPIEVPARPASRASSIHDLLNPSSSEETTVANGSSQVTAAPSTPPSSLEEQSKVANSDKMGKENIGSDGNESTSEQGSARKRDHDEMSGIKAKTLSNPGVQEVHNGPRPREPLTRSSSMVRLAMTADGAVKIRTNNEPTPSPEKPRTLPPPTSQSTARASFSRSKSAMSDAEAFRQSAQGQSKIVGAGFGRSRDSRTWEFYCDSTAKDALSIQAEAETAGSAISAINLVRSNSFKSRTQALSPSTTKTNGRISVISRDGKSKLSRTKSSLGRLQSFERSVETSGDGLKSNHVRSPSGDSDKENWAPGTRASINHLRRTEPSVSARPVLQANESVIFRDASPATQRSRPHSNLPGIAQSSPSKEKAKGEELDCVQGLLSLSQGAWR